MQIKTLSPSERSRELVAALVDVWERSVRATHGFLAEEDILGLRPEAAAGIAQVAALAVAHVDEVACGFAGVQDGRLEMLFVAPEMRGRGIGGALLAHAVQREGARELDVNEQNPQALGFYERAGFRIAGRSPRDGAGRPFPLLHLRLNERDRNAGMRAQMASGSWFEAADASLEQDRIRARAVMRRFNADASLDDEARAELLRGLFGAFGEGSAVSTGAQVDYGYNVRVGARCFFNFNCVFGDDVWVGPNATFATPLHPLLGRERAIRMDEAGNPHLWERNLPITVGSDVWIASNVTVNPGVTIGDGAVIGSGSVVTRDVPPHTIAFGNPCRIVRPLSEDDSIEDALREAGLA